MASANPESIAVLRGPGPMQRVSSLDDGKRIQIRPMRLAELAQLPRLYASLSARSRFHRFMSAKPSLDQRTIEDLARNIVDPRSIVLVASAKHLSGDEIIGGARIVPCGRAGAGEFAVTVVDSWQGRGAGTALLRAVVRAARNRGYRRVDGWILATNVPMLMAARRSGFRLIAGPRDRSVVVASRTLHQAASVNSGSRGLLARAGREGTGPSWMSRKIARSIIRGVADASDNLRRFPRPRA